MNITPDGDSVEVTNSFIMFAKMSVIYDGRATSTLQPGYYLLIHKPDGSTMVHGPCLTTPLNYQVSGSKIYQQGWTLTVLSKKEKMTIEVIEVLSIYRPKEWSEHRIDIVKTERELTDKLVAEINDHIPNVISIHREFPTEHGPVDLVAIDTNGIYHVFEVKRYRISISSAIQLRKYLDAMESAGYKTIGYLVAPNIIASAKIYCERQGYTYIEILHRDIAV